ncbi:hypothetical protein [Nostoc sp. DedSLP03]|uniref:hypothetical protein n=1 Tax=Nostoc sp. DedSLP03 TaxID=3075400 RepID=UPI002AD58CAF|nr:hypothetical protein [Nostoc sp. DedSLP03]
MKPGNSSKPTNSFVATISPVVIFRIIFMVSNQDWSIKMAAVPSAGQPPQNFEY